MSSRTAAAYQPPGRPPLDPDGGDAGWMHVTVCRSHGIILTAVAREQGIPVGRLLEDIIEDWLWQVVGEPPMSLPTEPRQDDELEEKP